jgi:hypothetical protein
MDFCLPKLKLPLLAIATGAMVLAAGAQPSGQPIIFSSPQAGDAQSDTPSLSPQNSQMPVLPDTLQAPDSGFNFQAPNDPLALPPQQANASEQQRMGKMLEERKNWTLMTPAEIFGVTATEKLLQLPERDAMGREKNQTQLERYLDRENQYRAGPTNDLQNGSDDSPWNFSHDNDKDNANAFGSSRPVTDAAQNLNRFLNGQRNNEVSARQNGIVSWDSFNAPPAQPTPEKQNLEQLAAMERFRQLLEPTPASATPSPDSRFFPVPKTVLDPNIAQPDFVPNPSGASFTPLSSGIGKPSGLTALPGITTSAARTTTTPAWAPQPPPWLLQGPQPFTFTMPQRKF